MNAQNMLFGVTHECQHPIDAQKKPRIIHSVFEPNTMTSKEIDEITSRLLKEGKDIFVLDKESLKKANPDLIISQTTCEVCAAHNNQVSKAIQILKHKPIIYSMDPHTISEILESVTDFATIIDRKQSGDSIRMNLEKKVTYLKQIKHKIKPKVLAIEWIDPFFTAGHWIPEMIEIAGGTNLISKKGEHSRRLTIKEIITEDPEYIIFMPCGFDTKRGIIEYNKSLKESHEWNKLKAVRNGNVFVVDANSFFSKPSIRTIIGIEVLTKIIHPEIDIDIPKESMSKI